MAEEEAGATYDRIAPNVVQQSDFAVTLKKIRITVPVVRDGSLPILTLLLEGMGRFTKVDLCTMSLLPRPALD